MATADTMYTLHRSYQVPDVTITVDDPTYIYVPARGYSSRLIVFDINDNAIGTIDTRTLGHENVKAWMAATNWYDGGY